MHGRGHRRVNKQQQQQSPHDSPSTSIATPPPPLSSMSSSSSSSNVPIVSNSIIRIGRLERRPLYNGRAQVLSYHLTSSENDIQLIDYLASFGELLQSLVDNLKNDTQTSGGDHIQIVVYSSNTKYVGTGLIKLSNFETAIVLTALLKASQSGMSLNFDDHVKVDIKHFPETKLSHMKKGGSRQRKYVTISTALAAKERRSIVQIINENDNMCMSRSILVCLAKIELTKAKSIIEKRSAKQMYTKIIRPSRKGFQYTMAKRLCDRVDISEHTLCGNDEAKKFENVLKINIVIVAGDTFNEITYNGMVENPIVNAPVIYLYRRSVMNNSSQLHYDAIVNIVKFHSKRFYCQYCHIAYNYLTAHRCTDKSEWCYSCWNRNCLVEEGVSYEQKCTQCAAQFRNIKCAQRHALLSNCHLSYFCRMCYKNEKRLPDAFGNYESNDEVAQRHVCVRKCTVCKQNCPNPFHKCFIQKQKLNETSTKYLFFDFESDLSSGTHVPIYCHLTWYQPETLQWVEKSFGINTNVRNDVGQFMFSKQFRGYTIIAHNMKGYDGCFLLQYLAENSMKPKLILQGKKILALSIPKLKIRVIDSLNFLSMPLSALPKAFNFEGSKGHFPHFFSNPDNYKYIGPLPLPEYYGLSNMKPGQLEAFNTWYQEQIENDVEFNFEYEMRYYCRQDVLLLREACWRFRTIILDQTNGECDPFQYFTLPSVCAAIYKNNFMVENTIAAVPPNGYATLQHYSSQSLEWLEYVRLNRPVPGLKHIGNSATGEARIIGEKRVDGLDEVNRRIFEYNGCFYHACPDCYANRRFQLHPLYKVTFDQVYQRTVTRNRSLRLCGYQVETMWECQWLKMRNNNPSIKEFLLLNQFRLQPLNPFNSLFGGRVETFKMLVNDESRKIKYEDVNSLYPYVNATKRYPVGHPEIISESFGDPDTICDRFFGIIYCKVLPPTNLYIPVLPKRYGGKNGVDSKLLFTLCNACAEMNPRQTSVCNHSDEERSLVGTWVTEEMRLAVSKGYIITQIYSIYHFEESSTTLFADYIKTFYKLKLLSSGKPKWCDTEEKLKMYVNSVKETDGVDLASCQFEDNPGLRNTAKLMINSLWGKFGTRRLLTTTKFCSTLEDLNELLNNPELEVVSVVIVHDNMTVAIYHVKSTEYLDLNNNNNIYIASYTTAYARIELYKHLDAVNRRAIYCDTDSIIYISEPGFDLPTGDMLGQLKNELAEDDYIILCVSSGAKYYAFRTKKGVLCFKMKGFSLTVTNLEAFTIENIVSIVTANAHVSGLETVVLTNKKMREQQVTEFRAAATTLHQSNVKKPSAIATDNFISVYNPQAIARTEKWGLVQRTEQKLYTFNYDKRIITANYDTVPFGFFENM
jgi:hypothetical protein